MSSTRPRRSALVALPLTLAAAAFTVAVPTAPASAVTAPVACTVSKTQAALRDVPAERQIADTSPVTDEMKKLLPEASPNSRTVATAALPDQVVIQVNVHVIRGTHSGERIMNREKVDEMLVTLRRGFAGLQEDWAQRTRYTFRLHSLDYTRNDRWFHASNFDAADQEAKNALHRGGKSVLNLYVNGASATGGQLVLGWARFPWQQKTRPRWDSVTVSYQSLPGGTAAGYNEGDTVLHEVGHWMGLFHTFEGGCGELGDRVSDTAPEAQASFDCEIGRDTCAGGGVDDIQNFMDYSLDACMRYFRDGQVARMDMAWATYRQP